MNNGVLACFAAVLSLMLFSGCIETALLGFLPGVATDAKSTPSAAYWRGEARPFAILEHTQIGNSLTLVMQNIQADQLAVESISVASAYGGGNALFIPFDDKKYFAAGEKRTITISLPSPCAAGNPYEFFVNITYAYASRPTSAIAQIGAKTIYGRCAGDDSGASGNPFASQAPKPSGIKGVTAPAQPSPSQGESAQSQPSPPQPPAKQPQSTASQSRPSIILSVDGCGYFYSVSSRSAAWGTMFCKELFDNKTHVITRTFKGDLTEGVSAEPIKDAYAYWSDYLSSPPKSLQIICSNDTDWENAVAAEKPLGCKATPSPPKPSATFGSCLATSSKPSGTTCATYCKTLGKSCIDSGCAHPTKPGSFFGAVFYSNPACSGSPSKNFGCNDRFSAGNSVHCCCG